MKDVKKEPWIIIASNNNDDNGFRAVDFRIIRPCAKLKSVQNDTTSFFNQWRRSISKNTYILYILDILNIESWSTQFESK